MSSTWRTVCIFFLIFKFLPRLLDIAAFLLLARLFLFVLFPSADEAWIGNAVSMRVRQHALTLARTCNTAGRLMLFPVGTLAGAAAVPNDFAGAALLQLNLVVFVLEDAARATARFLAQQRHSRQHHCFCFTCTRLPSSLLAAAALGCGFACWVPLLCAGGDLLGFCFVFVC